MSFSYLIHSFLPNAQNRAGSIICAQYAVTEWRNDWLTGWMNELNWTKWKPGVLTSKVHALSTPHPLMLLFKQDTSSDLPRRQEKVTSVSWSARLNRWALILKFMLNTQIMSNIIPPKLENNSPNWGEEHLSKEHESLWFLLEAAELVYETGCYFHSTCVLL